MVGGSAAPSGPAPEPPGRLGPALGTVVFSIFVPGAVAGLVPWWVAAWRPGPPAFDRLWLHAIGAVLLLLGAVGYLWCARDFVARGFGTPAPIAAPKRLVVQGLYGYTRNPMYVSVLLAILGQGLLLGSAAVLGYGALVMLLFTAFVRAVEEPLLAKQFGEEYLRYRRRVPRWIGVVRAGGSSKAGTGFPD